MVRPIALAVLRLITSWNLVGSWTGKSLGFAPSMILAAYEADSRKYSFRLGPYAMTPPASANSRKGEIAGNRFLTVRAAIRGEFKSKIGDDRITMALIPPLSPTAIASSKSFGA